MRDQGAGDRRTARGQLERNEEVAASATPQGDGTPDEGEVTTRSADATRDARGTGHADPRARGAQGAAGNAGTAAEDVDPDADALSAEGAEDAAERELAEQRDKYLRLAAEFDNYRKRVAREREETAARAQGEIVRRIMDSLDDLSRVLAVDASTATVESVVHGVHLVENKLRKALTAAGLEVIDPIDQPFNPELHEAVSTEPALSPEDDHTVGRVYQVGYQFGGQLLRPARVVVKQWNG
ncbi:MAG TPA: nucleotide exchange factor GrpE [Gemmatimonadaceae bacterium]|nr:nucleotide exchange factor GrpE [Gemmatimonadaceae bacterium]